MGNHGGNTQIAIHMNNFTKKTRINLLVWALAFALAGCKKETPPSLPTVSTDPTGDVTATQVEVSGEVTADGNSPVTERGFMLGKTSTAGDTKIVRGAGVGTFSGVFEGLQPGTSYYFRAFATNAVGTAYGAVHNFMTQSEQAGNEIIYNELWLNALTPRISPILDEISFKMADGKISGFSMSINTGKHKVEVWDEEGDILKDREILHVGPHYAYIDAKGLTLIATSGDIANPDTIWFKPAKAATGVRAEIILYHELGENAAHATLREMGNAQFEEMKKIPYLYYPPQMPN